MEIITYENIEYVKGEYILENAPIFSKKSRGTRDLIRNKKINEPDYIYLKKDYITKIWIKATGESAKFDKVFISKNYIDINVVELNGDIDNGISYKLPNIINLDNDKCFRDDDGNILNIEIRGDENKLYFKVKDVSEKFKIEGLKDMLLNNENLYNKDTDYIYFKMDLHKKKELFLTFEGLLRLLVIMRNKNVTKLMAQSIYSIQFGSATQKNVFASSIIKTDNNILEEMFNEKSNNLPYIYLFQLGTYDDLKDIMDINNDINVLHNDSIICKLGYNNSNSNDMDIEYLTLYYNNIIGVDAKLQVHKYIDLINMEKVKCEIFSFISTLKNNFDYNGEKYVIIPKKNIDLIENIFSSIGDNNAGHTNVINKKIKELETSLTIQKLINQNNNKTDVNTNKFY